MSYGSTMKIETVVNHKCELGEGPVWDAPNQSIYWVDILQGEVHRYDFRDKNHRVYPIKEMIGSLVRCKDGRLAIAAKSGFGFLDTVSGRIEMSFDPESHLPNNRFNDGKCDPHGRFWAGTMSLSETAGAGSLYVFDNKTVEKKVANVTISNGLAWSLDHKTLYYIDTPTFEVVAYDYEAETGRISNKTVALKIPETDGSPDGMTIDTAGMLWIAHWGGWQVTRWNPRTGKKLLVIKLPVSKVTACTFGGENWRDLFITSAKTGLSETELKEQPLAGSLFVIRDCGFQGLPAFEFNN
jgi:sugar lactone lactonase YvrE